MAVLFYKSRSLVRIKYKNIVDCPLKLLSVNNTLKMKNSLTIGLLFGIFAIMGK